MVPFVTIVLFIGLSSLSTAWQAPRSSLPRLVHSSFRLHYSFTGKEGGDDDPVLCLPLMEAELATLSSSDQASQRRVELEQAIGDAKTAAELGVRRAQVIFYEAISSGDMDIMEQVWSTESHVRCIHPGLESLEGREEVMESWRKIFSAENYDFAIAPSRTRAEICGQTALCSCIQKTPDGTILEALNVYRREGGHWRMTLHYASPIYVQKPSD